MSLIILLITCPPVLFALGNVIVYSPDKQVRLEVFNKAGALSYNIQYKNKAVINASALHISVDKSVLTNHATITGNSTYSINESYPWYGAHSLAVNHFNGAKIKLQHGKISYQLDVRVFNDAAAFSFIIPGNKNDKRIPDETTEFNVPAGSTIWYHDLNGHYEGQHTKKSIDSISAGQWIAPPATFKLPGNAGYASITEADLKNYAGMALQSAGQGKLVLQLADHHPISHPYELRYSKDDIARVSKPAAINGTITTPWRVVMIGSDLNTLVNCDAVHNLCPPPDKKYFPDGILTSWIKPGRAVWQYLDGAGDKTVNNMKEYSRLAAELGFEHNILEGFWEKWSDDEIKDLTSYSKQKGVDIWVWMHSKDLRDASLRQAKFKRCHDLGISGLKIDFFDNEAKEVVDLYQDILMETAQLHLMVDFHGSNKPTGQLRTWPNELTREAVKGMESSRLADRATHSTTLPFTRFLAGPAEYTPVHFGERRKNTTWTNQIASAVILTAPVLTYAASPQHLLENPGGDIIKSIPSTWNETIVLQPSAIGELAVFARRKGNTWFLAVMNGAQPKNIQISLSFLKASAKCSSLTDDPDNTGALKTQNSVVKPTDVVSLSLGTGGGYVARFNLQ
ncbi:glycoside hydrolase family 97 protein [Mucilaginibacter sp. SG564]|uniref:glycoside hydrolase family 97 protein n=1 Tax=Mucilaginibacter sp. SG564 TaxID=2587022 RepID=UPI00155306C8|nr:glycoside hydrolase family 97 protein [Mucilaginibacter sp. SG564]NOW93521.1 alpha-glucosidase [Mucilaginibacter sp. SG564]